MAKKTLSYYKTKDVLAKEKGGTSLTIQDNPPVIGENWKRAPCECHERMEAHHSYDNDLQIINEMIEFRTQGARCPSHNTSQYTSNVDKSYYGDMDKAMKLIPCSCNMKKYLDCKCDMKASICECQKRTACPEDWNHISLYEKTGDFENKICQCYTRVSVCAYNNGSIPIQYRIAEIVHEGFDNHVDPNPTSCDCNSRTVYNCMCKMRHTEDCKCNLKAGSIECECRSRQILSCVKDGDTAEYNGNSYCIAFKVSKISTFHDSRYWVTNMNLMDSTVINCACKNRLFDTGNYSCDSNYNNDNVTLNGITTNYRIYPECECYKRTTNYLNVIDEVGNECMCVYRTLGDCHCKNDDLINSMSTGCECYLRDFTTVAGYNCLCKQRNTIEDIDCLRDGVYRSPCISYNTIGSNDSDRYYTNLEWSNRNNLSHICNNNTNSPLNNIGSGAGFIDCDCVMRGFTSCQCDLRYAKYIMCKCNSRIKSMDGNDCDCVKRTYITGCDIYNIPMLFHNYHVFYSNENKNNYQLNQLLNCNNNYYNESMCTNDSSNAIDKVDNQGITNKFSNYYVELTDCRNDLSAKPVYYVERECDCKNRNANDCTCKKRTAICACNYDTASKSQCNCDNRVSTEKSGTNCYCKFRSYTGCNCDNQAVSCLCDLRTMDFEVCDVNTCTSKSSDVCECNSFNNEIIQYCKPHIFNQCECVLRKTANIFECSCKYRTSACTCFTRTPCICVSKIILCACDLRTNEYLKCFSDVDQNRSQLLNTSTDCICQSKIIDEIDNEHICQCQKNYTRNNCKTKFNFVYYYNNRYIRIDTVTNNSIVLSGLHDYHKNILDYTDFENEE